ncbi:aryl-sulfate sulfotransferase [bacterium]|nr:aryl-sulfate sulfotransferase [bacterium]
MKRFLILTAVLSAFLMVVSCGGNDRTENVEQNDNDEADDRDETDDSDKNDEDGSGNSDCSESVAETDLKGSVFEMPKINPSGNIPLSAAVPMQTAGIAKVSVRIADKDPDKKQFSREYDIPDDAAETVQIPVLGLFPAYKNQVTVTASDKDGRTVDEKTFGIKTSCLPKDFPKIKVSGTIDSGWTMVNWLRTPRSRTEMNGIALDEQGRVRWYSDLAFPVCFPIVIKDETFYCGGGEGETHVTRYDFMGYVLEDIDVAPLGYRNVHHEVFIKPDGNYLIGVDKADSGYIEDRVIEINPADPANPQLRGAWNLNDTLPDVADLFIDMQPASTEIPGQTNNPIHHNAIFYDESDDSLIVGSQTAGIVKLTHSGYVKWYLAPHLFALIDDADNDGKSDSFTAKYDPANQMTWTGDYSQEKDGKTVAGEKYVNKRAPINGIPYKVYSDFEFSYPEFLLTPLDKNGSEIEDLSVKQGFASHEDFSWPFRAHNPTILKNGNIMIFDNGLARNFSTIPISQKHFSRVVEYRITPDKDGYGGTIRQIWEYILEDDPMWYSMSIIVSGANELENGNRLITSGSLGSSFIPEMFRKAYGDGPVGAFIVEVDPKDNSEKNRITLDRYIDDDYPVNEFSAFRAYRFEISASLR